MKIVLFRTNWRSIISIVISIVTKENYSHAAVLHKGKLYDASESHSRGAGFGGYLKDYGSRKCDIYDIGDHANFQQFLAQTTGIRYDWTGIFGWVFNKQNPRKLYCYEYVLELLVFTGVIDRLPPSNKHTASEIKRAINLEPIYSGASDNYYNWRDNAVE